MTTHEIVISSELRPSRTVVSVEPRRIDYPSGWFALDEHAMDHALRLQRETGWRLVDRRTTRGGMPL